MTPKLLNNEWFVTSPVDAKQGGCLESKLPQGTEATWSWKKPFLTIASLHYCISVATLKRDRFVMRSWGALKNWRSLWDQTGPEKLSRREDYTPTNTLLKTVINTENSVLFLAKKITLLNTSCIGEFSDPYSSWAETSAQELTKDGNKWYTRYCPDYSEHGDSKPRETCLVKTERQTLESLAVSG